MKSKNPATVVHNTLSSSIRSVNLHVLRECNLACRFCFATFRDVHGRQSASDWREVLKQLADAGTQKVNFAGGEPTLLKDMGKLIRFAKSLGMTTSIVTNGIRLACVLKEAEGDLDWVGLSVDSSDEDIQQQLGRGRGTHVQDALELGQLARRHGCRLKLNSVITALNANEDMSPFVRALSPDRWKVFQVLDVKGQNDGSVEELLIEKQAFDAFVDRHRAQGLDVIAESNEEMLESYVMVDPLGRFFSDSGRRHSYSERIVEVGVPKAYAQVIHLPKKTAARGGYYDWARKKRGCFVVVEGLDGVGKSTVVDELAKRIDAEKLNTPGVSMRPIRFEVERALSNEPNSVSAFYASTVIAEGTQAKSLCDSGVNVVMDRYHLSTVAYARARGATIDLDSMVSSIAPPTVTIVLHLDEEERLRRLKKRGATEEDRKTFDARFASVVRDTMAAGQPRSLGRVVHLDCTGLPTDSIVNRIVDELERSLNPLRVLD